MATTSARLLHAVLFLTLTSVVVARDNGLGYLPPLGWNTWCTWSSCDQPQGFSHEYHDVCNEDLVKSVAQEMLDNGMHAAGYHYVNLDDCWEDVTRAPDGSMRADPARFTGGSLKPLADWLHARNFKFGMYTSAGLQTCSTGNRSIPGDPSARGVPGSLGHYKQDADTFASWGVDYVKLDWCTSLANNGTLALEMAAALNSTGRAIWLNFHCDGAYADWCPVAGNSWRLAHDHHDDWSNTASIIDVLKDAAPNAGHFRWNDPDFLMTGGAGCDNTTVGLRCPGQTETEYRTEFSLWSMAAAPLLVATDVRKMTDFMRTVLLNTDVIAIQQDPLGVAGGLVGYACGNDCQVWARPLYDGSKAVALFNSASVGRQFVVPLSLANVSSPQALFKDLWSGSTFPVSGNLTMDVDSHETKLYRVFF